ncbi:MAG: hypothetical protein IT581_08995 [Verrucomicrobiales bacterium]|nr:hypothetical protein [Verrucomicrobiales bacterium]
MPTITFKVSAVEARQIRALARRQKLSVSEYLRRRAQQETDRPRRIGHVQCEYTGAMIFAPAPELAPLTTESVRDLLADFP